MPAIACALSADHDGLQWTFLKQQPEVLRRLYGLEVTRRDRVVASLKTVSIDAPGWYPRTTSFISWRRDRTACGVLHGFEQSGAGSGHLVLGVLNGLETDKVDQCF